MAIAKIETGHYITVMVKGTSPRAGTAKYPVRVLKSKIVEIHYNGRRPKRPYSNG